MLAALTRQGPDHVPLSPYIYQGAHYEAPLRWHDQITRAGRMLELGMDPTMDIWLPQPQLHPEVRVRSRRDKSGSETVLTKEYHTPAGVLRQVVVETDDWCSWKHWHMVPATMGAEGRDSFGLDLFDDWAVSRRKEPWIKGPEDLDKLRYVVRLPEDNQLDEWRMDAERITEAAGKLDVLLMVRRTVVGDAFQWLCDLEDFMCSMIEEPAFVSEFLGILQEWSLGLTELGLETDADVFQRRGWYETPTFWGVKYWQKYLAPCIEAETALVHDAGRLHSYLVPEGHGAYAATLKEMKMDILQGIDPRMMHGGDLRSLCEQLGDTKSFWGGVNGEVVLESCDAAMIEKEVRAAIGALGGNGGLVLSANIFPETPREGVMHMIDAWRKCC